MRIYRFDEVVSRPLAAGTTDGSIVSLARGPGIEACDVVHLGPGGELTWPGSAGETLLAVVSGSGWAEGESAERPGHITGRRELQRFEGALFAPGERQLAGSNDGMTLLILSGTLRLGAMAVTTEIDVVAYDPAWPAWFEQLREFLWPAVGDVSLRLDHVGSTSVPGLAAKAIIDLDIVVARPDLVPAVVGRLGSLGYEWRGDLGVVGREAFFPPSGADLPPHHLYLVVEGSKPHLDHVLLAELLRRDAAARLAYGELKTFNAERAGGDIDWYVAAKASFVAELLKRARQEAGLPPASYWEPETERG